MNILHNSRDPFYRMPLGAGACGEFVRIRIWADEAQKVFLRTWQEDGEVRYEMRRAEGSAFEYRLRLPDTPGVLWYYFIVLGKDGYVCHYGNARDNLGGVGELTEGEPPSYQITVYDPAFDTPKWMRNGVMMQIMVDRFARSGELDPKNLFPGTFYHDTWDEPPMLVVNDVEDNSADDFFGGNLKGLREKLPALRDMGISAIYLNPIFLSPSNHKYNTSDYKRIDPTYGTMEDFVSLTKAAEALGMHIVLDGVFSHTGDDSVYFNREGRFGPGGAYNDPKSPYYSWYMFERYPDKYSCWWDFVTLPNVNEDDPSYRKFIISDDDSVCATYIRAGADGWRLDVADELPMDFIRAFRAREKAENPEAALIGEVWEDPSNKVAYGVLRSYCLGDTVDATMNYPLREAIFDFLRCRIDAPTLVRRIESMRENQPKVFFYSQMNLTGSHDKARALCVLADVGNMEPERAYRYPIELKGEDYQRGRRRLIAAWRLLCALPGMPCVYYGDNAGMQGMGDPYCRGTYPWGREDHVLMEAFRTAAKFRQASQILRTGDMRLFAAGDDVVVVERYVQDGKDAFGDPCADGVVALAVNRSAAHRALEYNHTWYELPPQSATWLQ